MRTKELRARPQRRWTMNGASHCLFAFTLITLMNVYRQVEPMPCLCLVVRRCPKPSPSAMCFFYLLFPKDGIDEQKRASRETNIE